MRDKIVRKLSADAFDALSWMADNPDEASVVMALAFNNHVKSTAFVRRFRDLLDLGASDTLQHALESDDFGME